MKYVEIHRISNNTFLSVPMLRKIAESFSLDYYQRAKSSAFKVLASDMDLIVMINYLHQKGFDVHELSRMKKKNIHRIVKAI